MKKLQYIKYSLLVLFTVIIAGCTDFDKLNTNPTQSMDMDPNLQIPTIQLLQTNRTDDWHRLFIYPGGFMNQWTQDWAVVEYGGKGKKNYNYFSLYWDMYYLNTIKNAVDLEMRTRDIPEYTNINAMARILKVQNYLRLTDIYGDIPYSEAGTAYYSGNFKPKYDTQEDIYNDFFKELKEAAAALSTDFPKATSDLYYNGDITLWKKFANSLRLRVAMRLVKVDPERAKAEVQSAIDPAGGGVFTSNADICFVKHENMESQVMPSAGNGISNILAKKANNFRLSRELIGTMEDLGDPRILYYGGSYLDNDVSTDITTLMYSYFGSYKEFTVPAQTFTYDLVGDDWKGPITVEINGQEVNISRLEQVMRPSKIVTNFGAPYIHLSYAEVEFLLAEAVVRGYIQGNAAQHFKNGLEAAVNQWSLFGVNVPAGAAAIFSSKNPLQAGKELAQIGTQLWILDFLDPMETWSNWRRLGEPAAQCKFYNNYPNENQSDGQTPRRIEYPLSEQKSNFDEWSKAVERMGGTDDWLSRVWWDKK